MAPLLSKLKVSIKLFPFLQRSARRFNSGYFLLMLMVLPCLKLPGQSPVNRSADTLLRHTNNIQVDTIHPVVVTGQFRSQPVDKSIYDIEVIDNRQIRLKAANNLGDLLRTESGFQLRPEGILGDFLRIRGLTGEHVKILIDGIPVTGRVWDRIDLGQLMIHNVDHIEIIEGPMSVVYGSNALAGAINIISNHDFAAKMKAEASTYLEARYTCNVNLMVARRFRNVLLGFNGSRNFFAGWGPVDSSRYRTWKPKRQYAAGGNFQYSGKNLKIDFNTDYLHEELRDAGALTIENLYEKAIDGYHYTQRWNNRLNLIKTSGNTEFNIQVGYSLYEKKKISYLNDLVSLKKTIAENSELHDTSTFHLVSARGFVSGQPGNKMEYQAGFDANDEFAHGKRMGGNREIFDIAGFLNIIYQPVNTLSIQPGVRAIYNSGFRAPLIYALSIKFDPDPFTIKASYARGFRAPSLKQLYLKFVDTNHEIHGNENLKAETAGNFSFSVNYDLFRDNTVWGARAGLFYNAIDNAIQLAITKERSGWGKYFNLEGIRYKTKGGSLNMFMRRSRTLTISAGISATGRLRLDNRHRYAWSKDYSASVNWLLQKSRIQTAIFYKYSDELMEFTGNYDADGNLDGIAQQFISDYHMLDITLSRSFLANRLSVCTGVKNILNITEVDSFGSLDPHGSSGDAASIGYGRQFFVNIKYTFSKQ